MECFLIFVAIVIGLALVMGVGMGRRPRSSRFLASYQQLARRYGGSCHRPGWFSYPCVRFVYRSSPAQVQAMSHASLPGGRGPATQLLIRWPQADLACEVSFPGSPPASENQGGWPPLPIGPPDFHTRYAVRGTDRDAAEQVLNDVVRWQIEKLRNWPTADRLCVQFRNGTLCVTKGQAFSHYGELLHFVEDALALFDQALLTQSRGIEFVESQDAHVLGEVVCKVCGEEIQHDLVYCRRCRTPHHRECWQYNGMCSVFGCGETYFETPKLAEPLQRRDAEAETQDGSSG
jgi:hypothetical protein